MRYAVTGATGFLGANLVRHLLSEGHEVLALIRKPNELIEGLPIETSTVSLAVAEEAALADVLVGCDGIFHLAGIFDPSPGGEARMRTVHVEATGALCRAGARASVRRMVLCSSSITVGFGSRVAPGDEETPLDVDLAYGTRGALRAYHDTKLDAEHMVAQCTDIEGVIVNPDFIIGAWDVKPTSGQLLLSIARGRVPIYPRGGKCFQNATDCSAGHLLAMERGQPGRRYLLGSHNLSYREFMEKVAAVVNGRPPRWPLPNWVTSAAGLAGRVGSRIDAHRFAGLDGNVLRAMQSDRYRTDARARTELGLKPTPIEEGIEDAYRWFRERGYCA